MRLSFYQPDIPQNLGTTIRLSACFGLSMDIIEPCGFPLTAKALRRSVMDYGGLADVQRVDSWDTYQSEARNAGERIILFTTRGATPLNDFVFQKEDRLLFGRESAGVPDDVHEAVDGRVLIPMQPAARSINIATAAAIGAWEAIRQTGGLITSAP